jgi:cytochrome bd-type quinol oxidase subunit 2
MPKPEQPNTPVAKRSMGAGRLLIVFYAVFAVSATARASFQIITKFEQAPLAYSLSLVSALVYILATISLAKKSKTWKPIALGSVVFELVGVLSVGTLSFVAPELFAHPSVWSGFGSGYGYIPLVLPILGLMWIRKTSRDA